VVVSQLYKFLDRPNCVILFDEYLWALTHTDFALNAMNAIPSVFIVGKQKAQLIAFSG
jgi:hypothetical protein